MKAVIILTVSLLFINQRVEAQEGWFWQNPLPQGNSLNYVQSIDENFWFAIGNNSTVMKTNDGGVTWSYVTFPTNRTINGIFFIDADNGTAVGNYGTILTTTDGGQIWSTQISGTTFNLMKVQFINENDAVILGVDGLVLRTTDGGQNWTSSYIDYLLGLYDISFSDIDHGLVVNDGNKDEEFYANIGDYTSVYSYNDQKALERNFNEMYDEEAYFWKWNSTDERRTYRDMWNSSETANNNIRFVVGGLILNRIVSAINAARLVSSYNKSLEEEVSWNFSVGFMNTPNLPTSLALNVQKSF